MKHTEIILIAAVASNGVIGNNNSLIWHISKDLQRFKKLTSGHAVLMGRKTYESLPAGALPNRQNIVLTRMHDFKAKGCEIAHNMDEIFQIPLKTPRLFIIGGSQIYKMFLPKAHTLFLTRIHKAFEGDAYFPEFDQSAWKLTSKELISDDPQNDFTYAFETYTRHT